MPIVSIGRRRATVTTRHGGLGVRVLYAYNSVYGIVVCAFYTVCAYTIADRATTRDAMVTTRRGCVCVCVCFLVFRTRIVVYIES